MMTTDEHTGADGYAEFDGCDNGEVEVFVGGRNYGKYRYRDGEEITIKA